MMAAPLTEKMQEIEPKKPITQEKSDFRKNWPSWMKQLPRFNFPEINANFKIIQQEKDLTPAEKQQPSITTLEEIIELAKADKEMLLGFTSEQVAGAYARLEEDLEWLDKELIPLFRNLDHQASMEQNRYRLYQLGFMVLAAFATLIGSFQALALSNLPDAVPILAFIETVIALSAIFLSRTSGTRPPLQFWLTARQGAEYMRREYFRFIMNLPPYNHADLDEPERQRLLAIRATDINQGKFPDTIRSETV